jgi:hypothetical protein
MLGTFGPPKLKIGDAGVILKRYTATAWYNVARICRTMLGRWFNKGTQLSGGEWQKVALARALRLTTPQPALTEHRQGKNGVSSPGPGVQARWQHPYRYNNKLTLIK